MFYITVLVLTPLLVRVIVIVVIMVTIFFFVTSRCRRSRSDSVSLFTLEHWFAVIKLASECHLARIIWATVTRAHLVRAFAVRQSIRK